jgi:dATP/dGTP pyrophosphohydrolase
MKRCPSCNGTDTIFFDKDHYQCYPCNIIFPAVVSDVFEYAVNSWMKWTKVSFPKSSADSTLKHLQREIKEVLEELESDTPHPRQDNSVMTLMEYSDAMICLLTSAGKSGFTIEQLKTAIMNKMQINYKRKWKDNGDGTYSHVK